MAKNVTVFSSPGCVICARVKDYLARRGVDYVERDVIDDPGAMDELNELGLMTTPVTLVGDRPVIGFDEQKLADALEEQ